MKKFFFSTKRNVLYHSKNQEEYLRSMLVIYSSFVGVFSSTVITLINLYYDFKLGALFAFITILACVSAFLLIRSGCFIISKYILYIFINLAILFNGSGVGRESGIYLMYFPIIGSILLFFDLNDRFHVFLNLFFSLTCLFILEFTNYSVVASATHLSLEYQYTAFLFNIITSIFLVAFFIYYQVQINRTSNKKLLQLYRYLFIKNENLKKVNSELDGFVYKASHDLRSPLASVMGLISLMKEEKDIDKIKEYLSLQEQSLLKLDANVADILDVARNERMAIMREEIDFKKIIEESFKNYEYIGRGVSVNKIIDVQCEGDFISDRKRINIILNNLISNAFRYSVAHKPNSYIKIDVKSDSRKVLITIEDNGQGIEEKHLSKIFEMFYRGTDKSIGTGLGLYIVKECVEKLKGNIKVESEFDQYTKFIIELPNLASAS